jgi:ribosomal-protein-serine acetyltransferase
VLSPKLNALGLRPLRAADAAELYALVEANRDYLARWMPWAAGQDLAATEKFIAETEAQLVRNDGFQAAIAPEGQIIGVAGFHAIDWINRNTRLHRVEPPPHRDPLRSRQPPQPRHP